MNSYEKIEKLKESMRTKGIDAYIIPSSDPHQSEYVSEYWKSRAWLSGFTGSAGTLVITLGESGLWTDGRYFIQAEKQLMGSGVKLFKMGEKDVPTYTDWLKETLDEGACVGFDGRVVAQSIVSRMESKFEKKKISINDKHDLISPIWNDRPVLEYSPIINHDIQFAGKTAKEKLELVREEMKKKEADYFLLASLDDIAWLFNIRGNDIPNNSVVFSYALVSNSQALLFLDKSKLTEEADDALKNNNIDVYDYDEIVDEVQRIHKNSKVLIDPNRINRWIYNAIPKDCVKVEGSNITTSLKGIKNDVEIENLKKCQIKDGVAMVKFLYWLENNLDKETISEISASDKLEAFRSEQEHFMGTSFDTIAGYKEHAAMMHYKATVESDYSFESNGMFLVDSGGQYLDGTTDITRTIVFGDITDEEKRDFTLTLKGVISLSDARFLYGATGSKLDILARYPLWQEGIDYNCGSGHGVGFFLGVHEGPHGFTKNPNNVKLEEGMIVTIEPGVYKEGRHGIRIENTLLVQEDVSTEHGQFMKFETISYCPIDLNGICTSMLSEKERNWLNDYHQEVYKKVSPFLDDELKAWLKIKTRSI